MWYNYFDLQQILLSISFLDGGMNMSDKKPVSRSGEKVKNKNKKNRTFSILRAILLAILLIGFIGAGIVGGIVISVIKETPPIDASNIYELLDESSFILDSEGRVIEKVQTDHIRTIIQYSDIPKHVRNAFIAVEDERFWNHKGIDIKRIFGAAWTNFRTGSMQGASTINQQLAKNLYLTREKTLTRKIKDAYYGILLDKQLSKEQILEAYLNMIDLGGKYSGVQAAAQAYFSKDVEELTVAEAALIAGITRNPSRYAPIKHLYKDDVKGGHYVYDDTHPELTVVFNENCIDRQHLVLKLMKEQGYISEKEYQQALKQDIKASLKPNTLASDEISSYFGDLVQRDVLVALQDHGYSKEDALNLLHSGGLRIYSTMDMEMQKIVEEEYENPDNFPSTLKDENGNLLRDAEGNIQPQSAMVIIDPHTGEIKALTGGRMIKGKKMYNRALYPRQPGSAIKPIAVYTPAIDMGYTTANVIDDVPLYMNNEKPNIPWPKNWYTTQRYLGLMTVRESLQWSSNVAALKIASSLGPNNKAVFSTMFEYMEKMGITTIVKGSNALERNGKLYHDENYSTAMGGMTYGVKPLELTAAYGVLANEGVYVRPITFTKILDRHGNLILENETFKNRVLSKEVSYIMTDMLRSVVTSGIARSARLDQHNNQIPVAGKTGTTNDKKDAWFVGYTPYYVAGVWIGNDMPKPMSDGSVMAARLWQKIMARVHENHSPKQFEVPEDIVEVPICTKSGKLPGDLCSYDPRGTIRPEVFIKGTEPTETCDVHVVAQVHIPTGKLATEQTPPWEVESRVFTKRPIPYHPEEHPDVIEGEEPVENPDPSEDGETTEENYIVPADFIYELPTEYYDPLVDWNHGGTIGTGHPDDPGALPQPADNAIDDEELIDSGENATNEDNEEDSNN